MKNRRRTSDDLQSELTQEALRRERLAQSAIRIEQKARHMRIQEEKTKLAEERKRAEEIEKRNRRLQKILTLYHVRKVMVSAAEIASALAAILGLLRIAAESSPVAASAYNGIIRGLEQALLVVKTGVSIPFKLIMGLLKNLSKAVGFVFRKTSRFDSASVHRAIHKDFKNKINSAFGRRVDNSFYSRNRNNRLASKYVNLAIRMHDARYNDIVGTVATVGVLHGTIMPLLVAILKGAAIAGLAKSISEPLKKNVTEPIISRIVNNIKLAAANKGDKTYTEAILGKIKSDMNTLTSILAREKSFAGDKVISAWDKIKGMA